MAKDLKPFQLPGITAFFDGVCEPINPGGVMGFGLAIYRKRDRIWQHSGTMRPEEFVALPEYKPGTITPMTSNNVAEYMAFNAILEWLIENNAAREQVMIFGDSRLVIRQCFGTWKINQGFYVRYAMRAQELLKAFRNVRGFWIPRDENAIADDLSKAELRRAGVEFRIQPE